MLGPVVENAKRAFDLRAMRPDEKLHSILLVVIVAIAVGCEIYARQHGLHGPALGLKISFAGFTIFGGLVIILAGAESLRQFDFVGGGAFVFVLVAAVFFRNEFSDTLQLIGLSAAAGAMAVQIGWALLGSADRAVARLVVAYRFILYSLYPPFAFFFLSFTTHDIATYDAAMLRFDDGIGVRIPVILVSGIAAHPSFYRLISTVYITIASALAVHDAARRETRERTPMVILFLVSSIVGWIAYRIFPVAGPPFLVPDYYASVWPQAHPAVNAAIGLDVPRNCLPSLHTVWSLFLVMKLREHRSRLLRACFVGFAALTVLGALTIGRHWFIDIVIAPAFAVAIFALVENGLRAGWWRRLGVAAAGFGVTALWLLLLAQAPSLPPWLEWGLMAATVGASGLLYRQLGVPGGAHFRRLAASTAE